MTHTVRAKNATIRRKQKQIQAYNAGDDLEDTNEGGIFDSISIFWSLGGGSFPETRNLG